MKACISRLMFLKRGGLLTLRAFGTYFGGCFYSLSYSKNFII